MSSPRNKDIAHAFYDSAHITSQLKKTDWSNEKRKIKKSREACIKIFNEGNDFPDFNQWEKLIESARSYSDLLGREEAKEKAVNSLTQIMREIGSDGLQERNEFLNSQRQILESYRWLSLVKMVEQVQNAYYANPENKSVLSSWHKAIDNLNSHYAKLLEHDLASVKPSENFIIGNPHIQNAIGTLKSLDKNYGKAKREYDEKHSWLARLSICCGWDKYSDPDDADLAKGPYYHIMQ